MVAREVAEPVGNVRKAASGDDAEEPEEGHDADVDNDGKQEVVRRDEEEDNKAALLAHMSDEYCAMSGFGGPLAPS